MVGSYQSTARTICERGLADEGQRKRQPAACQRLEFALPLGWPAGSLASGLACACSSSFSSRCWPLSWMPLTWLRWAREVCTPTSSRPGTAATTTTAGRREAKVGAKSGANLSKVTWPAHLVSLQVCGCVCVSHSHTHTHKRAHNHKLFCCRPVLGSIGGGGGGQSIRLPTSKHLALKWGVLSPADEFSQARLERAGAARDGGKEIVLVRVAVCRAGWGLCVCVCVLAGQGRCEKGTQRAGRCGSGAFESERPMERD